MTTPLLNNYAPQIKGFRIRQQVRTQQDDKNNTQTLVKVVVKNSSNGIPKIRNDVICNGKHYPFLPLFAFTSEQDLNILQQISTIVLKDQNEILCQILSGRITQIKTSHFKQLRLRFKNIFNLELKVDPQELFLILISDQITKQNQFNQIFDATSQTQFVNLLKKVYQNCPNRIIPKLLRKITKYFNSTKVRPSNSVQRLKRFLKILKTVDQGNQPQEKQQISPKKQVKQQANDNSQEWVVVQPKNIKKASSKKQITRQSQSVKAEQKVTKKVQQNLSVPKKVNEVQIPEQEQKMTKKVTQTQKVKKTQKVTKKQKIIKTQKSPAIKKQQISQQKPQQNSQYWQDVQGSNDEQQDEKVKDNLGKMAFHADDSDEDMKYVGPKKKNKKQRNNVAIPLDPQFQQNLGKKPPHLKKQKKNNKNHQFTQKNNNNKNKNKTQKAQEQDQQRFDRRNNNRNNRNKNGSNNNEQSMQRGRRQFSKDNKKIDPRVLLGINGASDSVWRQRMRPPRFPKNQNGSYQRNRGQSTKQNRQSKSDKRRPKTEKSEQTNNQTKASAPVKQSKNLTLTKIFSIPEDLKNGKQFKFQKKNYNLFVNKLFWINISDGQVTIQKEGKGYIRKCPFQILDGGKGIMADGLTINLDGLSNLQDGGTAFGDPVFQQFTPNGQWFHLNNLDVYAYL